MSEIINEILVVEIEFPWGRLSSWSEERTEKMRADYIKSCLDLKLINSITLAGIITDVGPDGCEKKDIQIKI